MRSITCRLSLVCTVPSPDLMIFSSGAVISDSGVRISWAMLVKKLILSSRNFFSLRALTRDLNLRTQNQIPASSNAV